MNDGQTGRTTKKQIACLIGYLANKVITTFTDLGFDKAYIEDKQLTLAGKDRLVVLAWCNNLDSSCKKALADRLCVSQCFFGCF